MFPSRNKIREYIFTWSIENISFAWHKTGYCIASKKFLAGPIRNSAWTLRLYPRGYENGDYFSLFLRREKDDTDQNLAINFELSCISANLSTLKSYFVPETLKTFGKGEELGAGDLRFLSRHEVFGPRKGLYLPQDTLTVRCRMWKHGGQSQFGHYCGRTQLPIKQLVEKHRFNEPEFPIYQIVVIPLQNPNRVLASINLSLYEDFLDVEIVRDKKLPMFVTMNLSFVNKTDGRTICKREIVWFERPQNEVFRLSFLRKLRRKEKGSEFEFVTEVVYPTEEEIKGDIIQYDSARRIPGFLANYARSFLPREILNCPSLSGVLWNSYEKQNLCDLELQTKEKSFFVHSIVLRARSAVFLSMLTHEMKENIEKCVVIEDISADTLEKLLIFLYTDAFENLEWNTVIELYYAADKYLVEGLKLLCSSYLMISAVCERKIKKALKLAKLFSDTELRLVMEIKEIVFENKDESSEFSECKKCHGKKIHLALNSTFSTTDGRDKQILKKILDKISKQPKFMDDFRTHYKKLINGEIASEIVVKTKNATYPAFKTVLCVNSSIFKDKLFSDLGNNSADSITIVGFEDDIVSAILTLLHTDLLKDIQWDTAKKLYHASDFYKIYRLKFVFSQYLLTNLQKSNACDLLLLAHEHSDDRLQSAVVDYISTFEEILVSDDWAKFRESNLPLAYEILRALYKKISGDLKGFSSI